MQLKIGNAPCSWGIEAPDSARNPSWKTVLDECQKAGFSGIELGPVGFFPENADILGEALAARDLTLTAGVVFRPFHDPNAWEDVLDGAHRTFKSLVSHGAKTGVLIDSIAEERALTAGRPNEARRLDPADWNSMMDRVETIAKIGTDEYGLNIALHGHAAGFIEYKDEIENTLERIDESILSLCIDTGHCLYAGFDPIQFYKTHRNRTSYFHFKDIDPLVKAVVINQRVNFYQAITQGLFCNLGKGICDFDALFKVMQAANFQGWSTIEQECDPLSNNTLVDAHANHNYLNSILTNL
ncbi:TIM barrel protein [Marinomonas sp. 2405UD68-3]|uniref:TIM barrel protein n=1 Tax=Marinomonas sp. 2405UD68-3 TaxID=3391835 RepID=UPI0039C92FF0